MKIDFFNSQGSKVLGKYTLERTLSDPPTGTVVAYPSSTPPSGWLLCDGSEKSKSTYSALDAVLGTTYGANTNGSGSAGSTHFRIPDIRGRAIVGAGTGSGNEVAGSGYPTGGSSLSARSIGSTGGSNTVTLTGNQTGTPAHSHAVTETSHTHTKVSDSHSHTIYYLNQNSGGSGTTQYYPSSSGSGFTSSTVNAGFTVSTDSSTITVTNSTATSAASSHSNIQPSVVVNYIIKT